MKSQIKKLISIFACVCLLLTAIVIPASATDTTYTMIDKVVDLTAGTYKMAAYCVSQGSKDFSANPYHCFTGGDISKDLTTNVYSYNDGKLVKGTPPDTSKHKGDAVDVLLTAVDGKENTYYIYLDGKGYIYSKSSSNRSLGYTSTPTEWVASNHSNGGITMTTTSGSTEISIGSAGAESALIRSYSNVSTLKFGLYFFKVNASEGGEGGGEEPTCEHTATSTEPNGNETHKVVCDDCGETVTASVDCTDADTNGKCDVCGGDVAISCEHTTTATEPNGDETHKVVCDACGETITAVVDCTDDDANGKCDVCGGDVTLSGDGGDDTTPTYAIVDTPVAGTAYKFGMVQGNLNKTLYLNGAMDGHYMATTEKVTEAVDVYLEETDGGYHLYAMVSGTKKYMNIVVNGTYTNVKFEDTASSVYTYNSTKGVYETTAGTSQRAFGTDSRKTYNTISAVVTQYDQFFCKFYAATTSEGGNEGGEEPSCEHTATSAVPNGDETHKVVCDACDETITAVVDCTDADENGKCDVCEGDVAIPDDGGNEGGNDPVADNAEVSFEDVANRTSYSTEQQVWSQNGVTVTGDKDDSTNDVRDSSNPARFYMSSKVTIAYPQMTGIVIKAAMDTANDKDYTTAWSDSFDASLATATVDGTTVIIALNEAADTFEFDLTAQARAYTITVYTGEFNADDFIDSTPAFDPEGKTAAEIVDAAYALESGAAFEKNATLTGEIISVDTPYSAQHGNITVTIKVDGADANKPIMCYRLKGEGADTLAVGDKITVTGIIKNYNGTIEFDQGCTLDALVKGEGEVPVAPENPKEIVDAAFALESGKTLPYSATLTGKITNIEKINEQYGDVCLTIAVEGSDGEKELYCYNLKPTEGIDVNTLAVGDKITVTGNLKNYNGTIEFISCSFVMANTEGDGTGTGGTGSGEGTGTGTGSTTGGTTTGDATTGNTTNGATTDNNNATTDTTSPDTGDNVGAIVAMAAVAAAVLVVSKKRA